MKNVFIAIIITLGTLSAQAKPSQTVSPKIPTDLQQPLPPNSIYHLDNPWTNQNGVSLPLSSFRGQQVVISMVYLKCKFSCPLTVAKMKEVEQALSVEVKPQTQFILVTFDPLHDDSAAMLQFAEKNKLDLKRWSFLTTTKESHVRELSTLIDFKYKKLESGEFEHSYAIIALDENGQIIGRTEGSQMMPQSIAELLNKKRDLKQ